MSGNGRTAVVTDEDRERWERQAEDHDEAREQERHLGFVFSELRSMRQDFDAKHAQLLASVDKVLAVVDGMNAALGRVMDGTNTNEKRIAALEAVVTRKP